LHCARRSGRRHRCCVRILHAKKPTRCTFGGKNLETLFVTSISLGCSGDSLAGGLFAMEAGVRGLPENRRAANKPAV